MSRNNSSNSHRLYITEDKDHENVWFARTDTDLIARFALRQKWEIWFYPYKYRQTRLSLKDTLKLIEKVFRQFHEEKYEIHD